MSKHHSSEVNQTQTEPKNPRVFTNAWPCFWTGRNLFYRQPPSTFWCFVSLHFLTSWTLGPRHLNRTLQPQYVYIYIYMWHISYYPPMCGGELLPSTELHDYQDNGSPILGVWSLLTSQLRILEVSSDLVECTPSWWLKGLFAERVA